MSILQQMIKDAIRKEQEARQLYTDAMSEATDPGARSLLRELADQEAGHERALRSLTADQLLDRKIPDVADLQIGDYLVEKEITEDSTFQDILIYAMKREDESWRLYEGLRAKAEDDEIEQLVARLAAEEKTHKNRLEMLYDDIVYAED